MIKSGGKLFIISGPSGAGKSTVLKTIFERMPNTYFSVSVTTRQPRAGEADGVNYHFISGERFADMIAGGELLESAQYVGNFYGTPRAPIAEKLSEGINVFMDIEVQGVKQIKEKMPEAVSIFLVPSSIEQLGHRLRSRGSDPEDKIKRRTETAIWELSHAAQYDYIVINDEIETAVSEIMAIVTAEACKAESRINLLN